MGQKEPWKDLDVISTSRQPKRKDRQFKEYETAGRTAGRSPVRNPAGESQVPQRRPRVLTEEEKKARARARHEARVREQKRKVRRARMTLAVLLLILAVLIFALIKVNLGERKEKPAGNRPPQQSAGVTDTQAPEVSAKDIEIETGGSISYRNAITYSDNIDSQEDLILSVDNTQVDTAKAGVYTVPFTVTDKAGNVANGSLTVTVKNPVTPQEQEVYDRADEVLAGILTDDMDMTQQARAIYDWIRSNVHYTNHSEKDSWVQGASEGLVNGQGDCFVFASTAKVLLTRAEIPNIDVVKATTNPSHFWNLIDVGDGWYHYDTTPRKDGSEFFMWTDAEIEAYSKEHDNCHNFDRSLYPEIN